jgi:hypothetical protein
VFVLTLLLMGPVLLPLAIRWGRATQRAQEAFARESGVDLVPSGSSNPLSDSLRLYRVATWIDEQFDLGTVRDPEALRWNRIRKNRFAVLMIAAAYGLVPMFVGGMVDPGTRGVLARFHLYPTYLTAILIWFAAIGASSLVLVGDSAPRWNLLARVLAITSALGGLLIAVETAAIP